jgi:hypothetical protein
MAWPRWPDATSFWAQLFVIALLGLMVLALWPATGGQDWFAQADKVRHAGAFCVLWGLGWRAGLRRGWALAVGLVSFGVVIELAQSLTPDREASALDVLADAVGVLLGWVLFSGPRGWLARR